MFDRLPHELGFTTMAHTPQPSPPRPVMALLATLTAFTVACGGPSSLLSLAYLCLLFSLCGGRRCVQCVGAVRSLAVRMITYLV